MRPHSGGIHRHKCCKALTIKQTCRCQEKENLRDRAVKYVAVYVAMKVVVVAVVAAVAVAVAVAAVAVAVAVAVPVAVAVAVGCLSLIIASRLK